MRNYWKIILSLFLIGNALSVQAAVKSFTETFVLYTDSEGLTTAYNEGWCLDGKGSGTFGYYSSRSGTFPDPLDDGTITMESDWLDVKGAGNNKGAVFTVTGISGLKLAFQSGSSVTRYVRADISGTSGANITLKGGNDGTEGSMLETSELIPAEQYTITITSWADEECTSGADSRLYYVAFMVNSADLPAAAYVYDSQYANYSISKDPVYLTLTKSYKVTAVDANNYNSVPGTYYTEALKDYDLVVASESVASTNKFGIALADLIGKVPMLNLKAFYYGNSSWNWATAANPTAGATGWNQIIVADAFKTHPLFADINFTNTITLFDGTAKTSNNVQSYHSPKEIISADDVLATNGANGYNAIHEHKQSNGKNTYILIPLSYSAIETLTPDAKTLIANAASYVTATKSGYTAPAQVEAPVISYDSDNKVTISCPTKGATIYYGKDVSALSASASVYTESFSLGITTTVRAIAVKEGMLPSEEVSEYIEIIRECGPQVLDPERLNRGTIATYTNDGMLVSWRWLATDPDDIVFNVYRDGTKLNSQLLSSRTNYLDAEGSVNSNYTVEAVSGGKIIETSTALVLEKGYLNIPLDRPAGGTVQGSSYTYTPGDASVGDVDGDGEYEIILKWDPTNQCDNGQNGSQNYTGNVYLDCYKLNGTKLWRIDLGVNIRAGAHYTQFMVYDLDGDGKAEVACKTAPGTIDGKGNNVIMGSDDPKADYRGTHGGKQGVIKTGPEYLTVFEGATGKELSTVAYEPSRNILSDSAWGDSFGNRCERYLACVAYLDGKKPSLVMCRGYYTAAYLCAWDFDGKELKKRWLHASTTKGEGAYGEGAHSLTVGDVDGDGCDEIVYGACCIDHDGSVLYRTGLGHGDALHLGDFIPDREGLEVFMVHEEKSAAYGFEMRDAQTGEILSGRKMGSDIGRGLCADIDSLSRGAEYWSLAKFNMTSDGKYNSITFDCNGDSISTKRPSVNFRTYWTGNLSEELQEKGVISQWVNKTSSCTTVTDFVSTYGCGVNLIKDTPSLQADILGDWREECIYYDEKTKSNLMIFSTPFTSPYRVPCLMHDHIYRMSICWQNVAYNQPPHLGYYLRDYVKYQQSNPTGISRPVLTDEQSNVEIPFTLISDGIVIRYTDMDNASSSIRVYSLDGLCVYHVTNRLQGSGEIKLEGLEGLKKGVYLLSVVVDGVKTVRKIIQ